MGTKATGDIAPSLSRLLPSLLKDPVACLALTKPDLPDILSARHARGMLSDSKPRMRVLFTNQLALSKYV